MDPTPQPPAAPMPPPPAVHAKPGLIEQLGVRAARRPEPRLSVVLAAAGCALAVVGVLTIAGDLLVGDSTDFEGGGTNQFPGAFLSAAVMAAGYLLLAKAPDGPLSTAGVVASALAAPPLFFFLTFSESSFPPFSIEAILGLSSIVWLASYFVGPGKSHAFYLGAGLISIWLFVLEIVEGVFTFPFDAIGAFAFGLDPGFNGGFGGDPFSPAPDVPSPEILGFLTLAFAGGYFLAARNLDRQGNHGISTPFSVAALVTAPVGLLFLADSLGNLMTGALFVALGVGYGYGGAKGQRRFTTWLGGYYVAQGATIIVSEAVGDTPSATTVGIALIIVGAAIVALGYAVATQFGEPSETTEGPSTFTSVSAAQAQPPFVPPTGAVPTTAAPEQSQVQATTAPSQPPPTDPGTLPPPPNQPGPPTGSF